MLGRRGARRGRVVDAVTAGGPGARGAVLGLTAWLVAAALAEQDFSTFQFLQWYVSEQHEEERLFKSILDKIEVIGLDGKGIYFLDKEIRKLAGSAS